MSARLLTKRARTEVTDGRPTAIERPRAMRAPRGDRRDVDHARLVKLQELGRALLAAESTEAVAEICVRMIREIIACTHLSVVVFDIPAGQFFPAQFRQLVANAFPAL